MDIKKLTIFINLAETRSFSKTAINMHVTQPTVTHTIKSIESEIGTQLFNTNKH
ncbi:MAG: LysR family transcriptional regulator, partial [Lactobacillus gasseri]|nr:LysR family transcriptional regulator [Lactobacillus gasseri]